MKGIINKILSNKKISLVLLILLLIVPGITLSRYFYKIWLDHFYMSKSFYFQSDLLSEHNPNYTISNWSGVDTYVLTINMNSILNDKKYADTDIDYEIKYVCDESVECHLNKEYGTIPVSGEVERNRDYFTLTIVPKKTFVNNEETTIHVTTNSTKPYKKSIGATFTLKASKIGLSYEITDNKNDIFSVLRLTNSLTYYTVKEAFLNYEIGDEIDQTIYSKLSNDNKKKCSSLSVDLSFDPKVVNLDLTNAYYLKTLKDNQASITTIKLRKVLSDINDYKQGDLIDNDTYLSLTNEEKNNVSAEYDYINGFTVDIDAISSADIKFYKKDKYMNYTFPFVNESSIIDVR